MKGKCVNISLPCPKAVQREIIEAEATNFVCPMCGKPLVKVETPPPSSPPIRWIILAIAVLVIVGLGVWWWLSRDKDVLPGVPEKVEIKERLTLNVHGTERLKKEVTPAEAVGIFVWKSSDESVVKVDTKGNVQAVGVGDATVSVHLSDNPSVCDECIVEVKKNEDEGDPKGGSDYGVYEGQTVNGKPHGMGKFKFTKRHVISAHDRQKRMANPGEYVQGQFVNGEFSIGKHFAADGTLIQSLNIGVSPNGEN